MGIGDVVLKALGDVAGNVDIAGSAIGTMLDANAEQMRDKARGLLSCSCIQVCPNGLGGTQSDAIDFVTKHQGMAFIFGGVALCHTQNDFDVKPVSSDVYRWIGTQVVHNKIGSLHIQPCLIHNRKK